MSQIELKQAIRTSQQTIKPIKSKINIRDESLLVKAIPLYNRVPASIKLLQKESFKRELKSWIRYKVPVKPP